jgi:hypothetical protein
MTDFRALCAELVEDLELWVAFGEVEPTEESHALIDRARAALAQPEPQGPTDEEARELANDLGITRGYFDHECGLHISCADLAPFAESVLTRWGCPVIEPVPVAERLPGPEDCDAEGRCWVLRLRRVWDPYFTPTWALVANSEIRDTDYWLPHHALPVPSDD